MDTLFPKVLQAVAGENFTVYLYFNDGSVRLYDAKPLLALGGVFAPLQDEAFFKSRLTVLNDTAAWDVTGDRDPGSCVDLDPIELYESCPVVVDPLESASRSAKIRKNTGRSADLPVFLFIYSAPAHTAECPPAPLPAHPHRRRSAQHDRGSPTARPWRAGGRCAR